MLIPLLLSKLAHIVSRGWWSKSSGSMWVHNSATHDLLHEQVVVLVLLFIISKIILCYLSNDISF